MFGLLKPDKILPQLCAHATLLRVTIEFYAKNPWACTAEMLEDHKKLLWATRLGFVELHNGFIALEKRRQQCFEVYWYFSYLLTPIIMLSPVAKWKAMIAIALKDISAAQACLYDMTAPTTRVA